MNDSILFEYRLTDAWCQPICSVSIFKNGLVSYQNNEETPQKLLLNTQAIKQIQLIFKSHPNIFEYQPLSLESPSILDGVMNHFYFAVSNEKQVDLTAFNIGEVRNPNAHFSEGLFCRAEKKNAKRDIIPVKALEVVKTFDEIAAILIENGVDSDCLRLTYK